MSAPQQQGERSFAEVWCDSLEDLRKASTTKSGAERVIGKDEVVMRVACVLRLSMAGSEGTGAHPRRRTISRPRLPHGWRA